MHKVKNYLKNIDFIFILYNINYQNINIIIMQIDIKVVFAGEPYVGKTTLLYKEASGIDYDLIEYDRKTSPTIGIDFKIKNY